MSNWYYLLVGSGLYFIGQIGVWFQVHSQFFNSWSKDRPFVMALLGIPISLLYIHATDYLAKAFGNELWAIRLVGFAIGIIVFGILTYWIGKQGLNMKNFVTLILATVIVIVQVFWK